MAGLGDIEDAARPIGGDIVAARAAHAPEQDAGLARPAGAFAERLRGGVAVRRVELRMAGALRPDSEAIAGEPRGVLPVGAPQLALARGNRLAAQMMPHLGDGRAQVAGGIPRAELRTVE